MYIVYHIIMLLTKSSKDAAKTIQRHRGLYIYRKREELPWVGLETTTLSLEVIQIFIVHIAMGCVCNNSHDTVL